MPSYPQPSDISVKIIALEESALNEWNRGNPSGYLDVSTDNVRYFDPYLDRPLDGLQELKEYFEPVRGQIHGRYEMFNVKVQAASEIAVLSYNLIAYVGDETVKWNCTQVYRLTKNDQWKIIQTHWSFIKPELKAVP
jgi:hypothetical protein